MLAAEFVLEQLARAGRGRWVSRRRARGWAAQWRSARAARRARRPGAGTAPGGRATEMKAPRLVPPSAATNRAAGGESAECQALHAQLARQKRDTAVNHDLAAAISFRRPAVRGSCGDNPPYRGSSPANHFFKAAARQPKSRQFRVGVVALCVQPRKLLTRSRLKQDRRPRRRRAAYGDGAKALCPAQANLDWVDSGPVMCAVPAPLVRYETLISSNLNESAMRNTLLHTVATSLAVLTIGVSLATTPVLAAARHGGGGGGGSHHVAAVHRGGGAHVQYAGHRYGGGGGNYGGGGYYSGGGYYGGCNQGYYNQGCGPAIAGGILGGLFGQ